MTVADLLEKWKQADMEAYNAPPRKEGYTVKSLIESHRKEINELSLGDLYYKLIAENVPYETFAEFWIYYGALKKLRFNVTDNPAKRNFSVYIFDENAQHYKIAETNWMDVTGFNWLKEMDIPDKLKKYVLDNSNQVGAC